MIITNTKITNILLDIYLKDIIDDINSPVYYNPYNKIYILNKKTILNYHKKQKYIKKFI